jgi:hypothetical protein
VTGLVENGKPDATSVLMFTSDAQAWSDAGPHSRRFRTARTGTGGTFTIAGAPPGEYYIVAVPEEQAADWRDPQALDAFARIATRISIAEGETQTVSLRLSEVPR